MCRSHSHQCPNLTFNKFLLLFLFYMCIILPPGYKATFVPAKLAPNDDHNYLLKDKDISQNYKSYYTLAMNKLGLNLTDLETISSKVKADLYNTMSTFLQSTGKIPSHKDTIDKQGDLQQDQVLPADANYIILKGLGTLYHYGRLTLQFLVLLGLIIMPHIGIAVSIPMAAVIFLSVWLPPNIDPQDIGPFP